MQRHSNRVPLSSYGECYEIDTSKACKAFHFIGDFAVSCYFHFELCECMSIMAQRQIARRIHAFVCLLSLVFTERTVTVLSVGNHADVIKISPKKPESVYPFCRMVRPSSVSMISISPLERSRLNTFVSPRFIAYQTAVLRWT